MFLDLGIQTENFCTEAIALNIERLLKSSLYKFLNGKKKNFCENSNPDVQGPDES